MDFLSKDFHSRTHLGEHLNALSSAGSRGHCTVRGNIASGKRANCWCTGGGGTGDSRCNIHIGPDNRRVRIVGRRSGIGRRRVETCLVKERGLAGR